MTVSLKIVKKISHHLAELSYVGGQAFNLSDNALSLTLFFSSQTLLNLPQSPAGVNIPRKGFDGAHSIYGVSSSLLNFYK